MTDNSFFNLFTDCNIVFGYKNSTVCDVKKQRFYSFPTEVAQEIQTWQGQSLGTISKESNLCKEDQEEIIEFLVNKEIIFTDLIRPDLFEKLSLEYHSPLLLTNVIVDFKGVMQLEKALALLSHFHSLHIQIRFFEPIEPDDLICILSKMKDSQFYSIEAIVSSKQLDENDKMNLLGVMENASVIRSVFILNQTKDTVIAKPNLKGFGGLYFLDQDVINETSCGNISHHYFNSNITLFTESQHHNTCLNQKLSIDVEGNIKNCPSMPESYGNINEVTEQELTEIVKSKAFQKYWNIKKDDIKICRDCEFRHICTDCRAYREDDADMYSKPLKCGYNPYIAKWNTEGVENGYQTVAESIADGVVSEEYVYRALDA